MYPLLQLYRHPFSRWKFCEASFVALKFTARTINLTNNEQSTKGILISALPFNSKTHATLRKKIFVSIYAEVLYFLTTCAGWKVTKIYDHYTFKQDTFKRDFVVMNQNSRKVSETKVEKEFYNFLNNSKFGNDCRNDIENCK